jgi:hypothetical protein
MSIHWTFFPYPRPHAEAGSCDVPSSALATSSLSFLCTRRKIFRHISLIHTTQVALTCRIVRFQVSKTISPRRTRLAPAFLSAMVGIAIITLPLLNAAAVPSSEVARLCCLVLTATDSLGA